MFPLLAQAMPKYFWPVKGTQFESQDRETTRAHTTQLKYQPPSPFPLRPVWAVWGLLGWPGGGCPAGRWPTGSAAERQSGNPTSHQQYGFKCLSMHWCLTYPCPIAATPVETPHVFSTKYMDDSVQKGSFGVCVKW